MDLQIPDQDLKIQIVELLLEYVLRFI